MGLNKDIFRALEDIVGTENITEDPAILDTYNQVWGNKLLFDEKWSKRPGAVLLPGSTEDCQAIVKVCNRFKVKFKGMSSGFEFVATNFDEENSIQLDLKRMNRIIDFDEKNMHAVVEPYFPIYKLAMIAAKHGLYYPPITAGPTGNIIAASCCHAGGTPAQVYTGALGRTVLGVEWLLPSGDLIRLGTAEAEEGWYSAEGPGIGLRGILRGKSGANGGHGIITKASVKLFPWYGPNEWALTGPPGTLPVFKRLDKIPDGFEIHIVTFRDTDTLLDFIREVSQQKITISCSTYWETPESDEGNDELAARLAHATREQAELIDVTAMVILHWQSEREKKYRQNVYQKLCEKYQGMELPPLNTTTTHVEAFKNTVWCIGSVREAFRMTGDFMVGPGTDLSDPAVRKVNDVGIKLHEKYYKSKQVLDTMRKNVQFYSHYEHASGGAHTEGVVFYDPYEPDSLAGARGFVQDMLDTEGPFRELGIPLVDACFSIESATHIHQNWSALYDNYADWLRKIKQALDPEYVCDASAYVAPPVFP
jgi:glycolate oxidase